MSREIPTYILYDDTTNIKETHSLIIILIYLIIFLVGVLTGMMMGIFGYFWVF